MPEDFEQRLIALAERTMRIRAHCAGEDATRIYLVMPFLQLLGYDVGDPSTIVPEHADAVNFAIMADGHPVLALEAVGAAQSLARAYGRLRAYCDARPSVGVGIATNGVVFEAFIDVDKPHSLDAEPFLRLDMAEIAAGRLAPEAVELLEMLRAEQFDRHALAEAVYARGLRERLKQLVLEEFRHPSDDLCRLLLDRLGISNARSAIIDQHYRPILRSAMEQAIVVPVLTALRGLPSPTANRSENQADGRADAPIQPSSARPRAVTALGDRIGDELAAFGKSRRRSA